MKTEASNSQVFDKEWRPYLEGPPEDLRLVIIRTRIYVEKVW